MIDEPESVAPNRDEGEPPTAQAAPARQPLPAPHAKEDYATRMLSAAWRETVDLYLPDTPKDP